MTMPSSLEASIIPFKYDILKDPLAEIRVLTILPGSEQDKVDCTLVHVERQEKGYTCLSYCWGEEDAAHTIWLNGFEFMVRPNLYRFLHTARKFSFNASMWIDAISINQSDNVEKSSQVAMMGDIYTMASRTIVWLDLPLTFFDELSIQLNSLYQDMKKPTYTYAKEFSDRLLFIKIDLRSQDTGRVESATKELQACNTIFEKLAAMGHTLVTISASVYWTRVWILQEVLLSSHAEFLTSIPGEYVNYSLYQQSCNMIVHTRRVREECKTYSNQILSKITPDIHKIPSVGELLDTPLDLDHGGFPLPLHVALRFTCDFGCSDHRDRVFAILGLVRQSQRLPIDYGRDERALFYYIVSNHERLGLDGWHIFLCIEYLFEALAISPPKTTPLLNTKQLLKSYTKADKIPRTILWANLLERKSGEDRFDTQNALSDELVSPIGLYCPIEIRQSVWIMWEFKASSHSGKWHIDIANLRSWRLSKGKWTINQGVKHFEKSSRQTTTCATKLQVNRMIPVAYTKIRRFLSVEDEHNERYP